MKLISVNAARVLGAFAVALALHGVGALAIDGYSQPFAVRAMLVLASLLVVAGIGQTLVVIVGGIDLSIPFLIGFANVAAAQLYGSGWPFGWDCLLVLSLACAIGALNGALSAGLGVHPLLVTLGVGTAVEGAVQLWTKGFPAGSAPDWLSNFVSIGGATGAIPAPPVVLLTVAVVALVALVLNRTPFGRSLYAMGANPRAAPLALIRPIATWTATFALSGLFSGLAGILLLGFTGSAFGDVGQPYMFQTIAAVVVGGTALSGGSGSLFGTLAGAIVLTEINTLLIGLGLSPALVQAALGAVIIVLVSLYGREAPLRASI